MIFPNKTVTPVDSLFSVASYVLEEGMSGDVSVDQLYDNLQIKYPKPISWETVLLSLNFLYIIGKLDVENEIIKIKL